MSCGCINATENHATLNRLEAQGKSGVDHLQFSVSRKSFATSYLITQITNENIRKKSTTADLMALIKLLSMNMKT